MDLSNVIYFISTIAACLAVLNWILLPYSKKRSALRALVLFGAILWILLYLNIIRIDSVFKEKLGGVVEEKEDFNDKKEPVDNEANRVYFDQINFEPEIKRVKDFQLMKLSDTFNSSNMSIVFTPIINFSKNFDWNDPYMIGERSTESFMYNYVSKEESEWNITTLDKRRIKSFEVYNNGPGLSVNGYNFLKYSKNNNIVLIRKNGFENWTYGLFNMENANYIESCSDFAISTDNSLVASYGLAIDGPLSCYGLTIYDFNNGRLKSQVQWPQEFEKYERLENSLLFFDPFLGVTDVKWISSNSAIIRVNSYLTELKYGEYYILKIIK